MNRYLSLLMRRRDYRRMWTADALSELGTWLSYIAVSVLVVQQEGSALALAMVFVIHVLPHAFLAPIAGPVADRFDRRTVLVTAVLVQGVVTLGMVAAAVVGDILLLQGLLLARVVVAAFHEPAARAALPRLVEPDELDDANALGAMTWSMLFAAGVALGGVVAAWLGPVPALAIDAVTFFVAGALFRGLPPLRALAPSENPGSLLTALRFARAQPALLEAVFAKGPNMAAVGGAWVSLNLLGYAAGGALGIGALQLARAVGTFAGPYLYSRFGWRLDALTFVGAVGFAFDLHLGWVLLAAFAWGAGSGANWVWSTAAIQRLTPDAWQGRMGAVDVLVSTLAMALGALLGGLLVDFTLRSGDAALAGLGLALGVWLLIRLLATPLAPTPSDDCRLEGAMLAPPRDH